MTEDYSGTARMSEDELLAFVVKRAERLGLEWFHSFDTRRDKTPGFPDLVLVGHGIYYRELKSADGPVSVQQMRWGRALRAGGGNWSIWRPADVQSGRVQRELRELAECPYN